MNIKRYPMPKTKEPFVNAQLEPAGFDPVTGEERFWISSCNTNVGNLGLLITENGVYRTYQFEKGEGYLGSCAYSTVYMGDDILWLIPDTCGVRRVDLKTGETTDFMTGGKIGLVSTGMQYDEKSGKVLILANSMQPGLQAVVFNLKTCKTEKIFSGFSNETGAGGGFPNGDGTYTVCCGLGSVSASLRRWDPADDTLTHVCDLPQEAIKVSMLQNISGPWGQYIPGLGWFDGYEVKDGPRPEKEAKWFGTHGDYAYGSIDNAVWRWDMTTGAVTKFCDDDGSARVTRDGCIVSVSLYGLFRKYGPDGTLRIAKWVEADSYGRIDCLVPADNGMIIGTPFITQRFWIFDENTGKGYDAGKAAPGAGEVLRTWNLNGKIYMAAYTAGCLVEFDPTKPANFPENPCVVADSGKGMRPVAHTADDRCLYYACNHHYGHIGCVMTKYDTVTGEASYLDNPMDNQHIISLYRTSDALWAGTTWQSDSRCCNETSRESYLLKLDPVTMEVLASYRAPEGTARVKVEGEITGGLFVRMVGKTTSAMYFCPETETFTEIEGVPDVYRFVSTGIPGDFITMRGSQVERWAIDAKQAVVVSTILDEPGLYNFDCACANGKPVICAVNKKELFVIRDFLD